MSFLLLRSFDHYHLKEYYFPILDKNQGRMSTICWQDPIVNQSHITKPSKTRKRITIGKKLKVTVIDKNKQQSTEVINKLLL